MNHPAATSKHDTYATAAYRLQFLTPAFVGDANQNGRWRTPPIKALLRQWWRVAYAADKQFAVRVAEMRHAEGMLFGHAWLETDRDRKGKKIIGRKSSVRIRLEASDTNETAWAEGHQSGVAPLSTGLDTSYAWFGLVDSKTNKSLRTGIKAGEAEGARNLKLAWPQSENDRMLAVLRLIRDFGQLGARSRGGWGAVHVEATEPLEPDELLHYAQPIEGCLNTDWPASFTSDVDGLWIWQSQQTFSDWAKLMDYVARRRKDIRTSLKDVEGSDLRYILGTAKGGRVANPLRWRPVLEIDNTLRLRIFAMPWQVSSKLKSVSSQQLKVAWLKIAQELDQHAELKRYTK